jgi:ubiquinone/menaquinone biosynthesis C-methylase UbiE
MFTDFYNKLPIWAKIFLALAAITVIYSKFFRKRVFAYLLNSTAGAKDKSLEPIKRKIFEEAFSKVRKTNALKIIEIGVGTGTNFKYYPENSEIIISDKTDDFVPYLNESLKKINREDLKIHDFLVNNAENMSVIESNSVDIVVATFTLCSIDSLTKAFNEIYRVLRPDGVFIFMDHSKNTNNFKLRLLQTIIGPVWSFICGDCRFRDIKSEFKKHSKFESLQLYEYDKYSGKLSFLTNPIVYGYAQKGFCN